MREYLTGDSFKHVEITLNVLMDITEQSTHDHTVLGVSRHFIQLDGVMFPKLSMSKTFDFCYSKPEAVSISEYSSDFDIRVFGKFKITIYSQMTTKRIESKINREFQKWINAKVGVYGAAKKVNIILNK